MLQGEQSTVELAILLLQSSYIPSVLLALVVEIGTVSVTGSLRLRTLRLDFGNICVYLHQGGDGEQETDYGSD